MNNPYRYKWDRDSINDFLVNMNSVLDDLRDNKDFLENINETIRNAWQGAAGTQYDLLLKIDMQNYNSIIVTLERFCEDIRKALQKYEECESMVKETVSSLQNKVGV